MKQAVVQSDTVILIDAAFLNLVVEDVKKNFERMLNRPLRSVDVRDLIIYLALDAGVRDGDNKVQVLFVYDKDSMLLKHCIPSDLAVKLNDVAFNDSLGEFAFNSYQPEQLISREELYLEFLRVLLDAKEVKRMILVSFNEEYGDKVMKILKDTKDKELIQFRMDEPECQVSFRWEILAYPVMQALGIKGDELK